MTMPVEARTLRNLPLSVRLVLAVFLISVGLGYFSALVQLHFQIASPGRLLPEADDAVLAYHGTSAQSQLERLIAADEARPFNGSGSMRSAFTRRSAGWTRSIRAKAEEEHVPLGVAEERVRAERDGERLALIHWIRAGAPEQPYKDDAYPLPKELTNQPITAKFIETGPDGTRRVRIQNLIEQRCVRCHSADAGGAPAEYPLDQYQTIKVYTDAESGGGMSLQKLAQTTHVHLLAFSMLYGLTGLIFACTSYPAFLRLVLAPLPLVAQWADISCWWLARLDPIYGKAIIVTGGLVGAGLFLQIALTLLDLFRTRGRIVLVALLIAAAAGGLIIKQRVIDPFIAAEETSGRR
jgi:hypothetical protein